MPPSLVVVGGAKALVMNSSWIVSLYIKFPILQVIQRPANALKEMIENRFVQGIFTMSD